MAKGRDQLSLEGLFTPAEPQDGSLNITLELRNALGKAVKESGLSRAQICARMTDLVFGDAGDGEITKIQLDSWTAPSRAEWRFPLEYLPAFIQATGAVWLFKWLGQKVGCLVVPTEHARVVEMAALRVRKDQLARDYHRIKSLVAAPGPSWSPCAA